MSTRNAPSRNHKRRRVIRTEGRNQKPFTPWGLLPALGLGAVFFYGLFIFSFATIQNTASSSAQDALGAVGADWARVKASGQWITLEGNAPSRGAVLTATRAIEQATNNTMPFQIKARPVTDVIDKTTIRVTSTATTTSPPETDTPAIVAKHNWRYILDRGVLDLTGDVPDQTSHDIIINAAERRQSPPRFSRVLNNLTITGRPGKDGFTDTALRGIDALSQCDAGTASFTDAVFSLNCEADTQTAQIILRDVKAPLNYGRFGRIDVYSVAEADSCNDRMVALLSQTSIEFSSASAVIDPASFGLLDNVTEAAKACPGRLAIDGHTDNTGRATLNNRLSRQRAEAVRRALIDRGIAAGRLEATGHGALKPVADNETEAGRARNRRIEIKVIRPGSSPQ